MNVNELIEKLKTYNGIWEITIRNSSGTLVDADKIKIKLGTLLLTNSEVEENEYRK